ncbi:non-homologous end-joining DNA ligase [Nocardia sp. CC227C]|uniref:non-homologous end-joining DNA ligase n=1 Tax=Nocardia sp. CC227C TaxID=3044562 RepID=UPI00278C520E|nr:non-homologous end-joining DNA ligase [Nocardia sp. CC227C]
MPPPTPMLATAGQPPDNPGWAIEMKWDGARIIATIHNGTPRLYSRNQRDHTSAYPEIVGALTEQCRGRDMTIDGEIVAQLPSGAPSFGLLQQRLHIANPSTELVRTVPVQLFVFDVLAVDGEPTTALPYRERRELLDHLKLDTPPLHTPPYWHDMPARQLLQVSAEHGLEGIVSKRLDSAYTPGRSRAWIKTVLRHEVDAVVIGWLPGSGRVAGTFGSLLLAGRDETGDLVFIGAVGTGFTDAVRRSLRLHLDELAVSQAPVTGPIPRPVASLARWVTPRLVGTVEYREFTGGSLRHPSWRGLRVDKTVDGVEFPPR